MKWVGNFDDDKLHGTGKLYIEDEITGEEHEFCQKYTNGEPEVNKVMVD